MGLTRLEKASLQLESWDVDTKIDNDTLYVVISDGIELELSDFEINYRAKLMDEEE